ncbi:MAG: hypothetical protein HY810_00260, partial [Candidatus Omnitrophica bacterium]|nr:hypothetical protein [Candidatus Omnitrophota bacterium]
MKHKLTFGLIAFICQVSLVYSAAQASWLNRDVAQDYLQQRYGDQNKNNHNSTKHNNIIVIKKTDKETGLPNNQNIEKMIMPLLNKSSAEKSSQQDLKQQTASGLNVSGADLQTKVKLLKSMDCSQSEAAVNLIGVNGGGHAVKDVSNALKEAGYNQQKVDRFLGSVVDRLEQNLDLNKMPTNNEQNTRIDWKQQKTVAQTGQQKLQEQNKPADSKQNEIYSNQQLEQQKTVAQTGQQKLQEQNKPA